MEGTYYSFCFTNFLQFSNQVTCITAGRKVHNSPLFYLTWTSKFLPKIEELLGNTRNKIWTSSKENSNRNRIDLIVEVPSPITDKQIFSITNFELQLIANTVSNWSQLQIIKKNGCKSTNTYTCKQGATLHTLGVGRTRPSTWVKLLLIETPQERSMGSAP